MPSVNFDLDKSRRYGVVSGDHFDDIREAFSVANDAAKFARYRNRFAPSRKYAITPAGRFDVGIYFEIRKFLVNNQITANVNISDEFRGAVYPKFNIKDIPPLNLDLRDYQKEIVKSCLRVGRGVTVLATAGGKTLTIASLIESVFKHNKQLKCLVLVPNLNLVSQTYSDFKEYGTSFISTKWSGGNDLNLGAHVIIANNAILQSNKSDTSWTEHIDLLIVDEVHGLRKNNKINKIISKIQTSNKFGFTGTMPEEVIDQWNIIGKIGPVLYEKNSYQLRVEDYIANVLVQILKLEYNDHPPLGNRSDPLDRFQKEMDFLIDSTFRNNIISRLSKNLDNNCLILLDYIKHGQAVYKAVKELCPDKDVFFIRGDVDVDQREQIRKLMEKKSNIICIAISKIFSTGINIKNLHYILFAGSGKAKIKTLQSIGRGLRKHEDKERLVIFDIADQLYYGKRHLIKRTKFYKKEHIQYGVETIKE